MGWSACASPGRYNIWASWRTWSSGAVATRRLSLYIRIVCGDVLCVSSGACFVSNPLASRPGKTTGFICLLDRGSLLLLLRRRLVPLLCVAGLLLGLVDAKRGAERVRHELGRVVVLHVLEDGEVDGVDRAAVHLDDARGDEPRADEHDERRVEGRVAVGEPVGASQVVVGDEGADDRRRPSEEDREERLDQLVRGV